jgi:hypothetical protein
MQGVRLQSLRTNASGVLKGSLAYKIAVMNRPVRVRKDRKELALPAEQKRAHVGVPHEKVTRRLQVVLQSDHVILRVDVEHEVQAPQIVRVELDDVMERSAA